MTWRLVYIVVAGCVLAGIIHVSIILLVPKYSTRDAWGFLSSRTDPYRFVRLARSETDPAIAEVDPFFNYGVCRFNLDESGLKMAGPQTNMFWSASVFDEQGTVIYSLNNRTAINNTLDLLIVNPLQTLALREAQPEWVEKSVVIETNISTGFVVIRVLEPNETFRADSDTFFQAIQCNRYKPEETDG